MLAQIEKTDSVRKKRADQHRSGNARGSWRDRKVSQKDQRPEVAIRVYFEVEGAGSMRAGSFDTGQGVESAWCRPKSVLGLEAKPAPGHRFSHWVVANDFAGSSRTRRVVAMRGMVIKAVFVPLTHEDIRC